MPQINVTIAGRAYRMACGEGEEAHLEALAGDFDARIAEMRRSFGEIGDMRLHVMAALTLADESAELRRRIERLEQEVAALGGDAGSADERAREIEARTAAMLIRAAERLEVVARGLTPGQSA